MWTIAAFFAGVSCGLAIAYVGFVLLEGQLLLLRIRDVATALSVNRPADTIRTLELVGVGQILSCTWCDRALDVQVADRCTCFGCDGVPTAEGERWLRKSCAVTSVAMPTVKRSMISPHS